MRSVALSRWVDKSLVDVLRERLNFRPAVTNPNSTATVRRMSNDRPLHTGASTHPQDHATYSVSFKMTKVADSIPPSQVMTFSLFFFFSIFSVTTTLLKRPFFVQPISDKRHPR